MTKDGKCRLDRMGLPVEAMVAVKRYLTVREDVAFAYLFGSRAKGMLSPLSDKTSPCI